VNSIPSTTTPQETTLPSILKDAHPGDLITFESNRDVNSDIFIIKKDGSGQINLTNNPADDINPLWSPDGSSIAFLSSRVNIYYDLYVMRADGSQVKKLAPLGWLATWSPDGKQLAAYSPLDPQKAEKGRIDVIQSDGSALHSFPVDFSNTRVKQSFQLIMLHWTVDGKFIQFLIYEQPTVQNDISKDKWTIYQINLENGSLKRLLESKTRIEDWNGSDKAFTVLSLEENAWQWSRIEGQKRTTLATWQPEFGICSSHFGYFTATLTSKWSTDGKNLLLAAQCSDDATWLYLANADGTQITQLTNYPLSSFRGMSSDGKTITFSADLEVTGNLDIYLLNIQSALKDPATRPVRITRSGFSESAPDWQLKP
jgi:dipeptidyl aminopeptidase/acylaminoacyl peptidase